MTETTNTITKERMINAGTSRIHSEAEVLHALQHLIPKDLKGHETMALYRNVRSKYATRQEQKDIKQGVRDIETFRTAEKGLLAVYRAFVSNGTTELDLSTMYVSINPRDVPMALKETQEQYYKYIEGVAGLTKDTVRGASKPDYAASLDRRLVSKILASQSRQLLHTIDVDDPDPATWLEEIRQAIGDNAIEMIVQTKNGFHVVYNPKRMYASSHMKLRDVLAKNPGKGPQEKVTRTKGTSPACALPGTYQADHPTSILFCSCSNKHNANNNATISDETCSSSSEEQESNGVGVPEEHQ